MKIIISILAVICLIPAWGESLAAQSNSGIKFILWEGIMINISRDELTCKEVYINNSNAKSLWHEGMLSTNDCGEFMLQLSTCIIAYHMNDMDIIKKDCFEHKRTDT